MLPSTHRSRVIACTVFVIVLAAPLALSVAPVGARPTVLSGATEPTGDDVAKRTLVATGTARVRGIPDVLEMRLGVQSRGRTVGDALDRNNAAASKIVEVLFDGGVDPKDLQTSNFSIHPTYGSRTGEVTGYEVSNVLTVRLRDIDGAGGLIDRAAEAGGDDAVMYGVSFAFQDATDLIAAARTEAVRRARRQAEQLAEAADVELGKVQSISESSDESIPVFAAPEVARSTDVAIQPGTEELTVRVTIVYALR